MFEHHTRYTKLAYWLLAINGFVSSVTLLMIVHALSWDSNTLSSVIVHLVPLILVVCGNLYSAYGLYRRSWLALNISLWLYVAQIIGIEAQQVSLYFNTGIQFTVTWSLGDITVSVNLATVVIWLLLWRGFTSVQRRGAHSLKHGWNK